MVLNGYDVKPRHKVEQTLLALFVDMVPQLEGSPARVGGDFGFDPKTMDFYILIDRIPGGNSDRHEGTDVVDVEVFSQDYDLAESVALTIEGVALGYPHVVEVEGRKVVLDNVTQNVGVADLPWEDDSTYRLGATYVITARRR